MASSHAHPWDRNAFIQQLTSLASQYEKQTDLKKNINHGFQELGFKAQSNLSAIVIHKPMIFEYV